MNCIISSTWRVLSSQIAAGVPSRCEHSALARSPVKLGHSTPDEHAKHTHVQARACTHTNTHTNTHTHTHALIHLKTAIHLQCCMQACIHDMLNADAGAFLHSAPNLICLWSLYKYMRQSPLFLSSCVSISLCVCICIFMCVDAALCFLVSVLAHMKNLISLLAMYPAFISSLYWIPALFCLHLLLVLLHSELEIVRPNSVIHQDKLTQVNHFDFKIVL